MRSFTALAASILLLGFASAESEFNSVNDPKRFTFYKTPSYGGICDGDSGPDGETLWYQDLLRSKMGVINYKTTKVREFDIPWTSNPRPSTAPHIGNVTGLQCVVRLGKDGMIYGGAGIRNEIVQLNPRTLPPVMHIFSPKDQDPVGNLQNFNDAWAADNGLYFSQTTGNVVTLFDYKTHLFTNYHCKTPLSGPLGMRTDRHNNLWFTNFQAQFISMLNTKTGHITEYKNCCLPLGLFPEVLRSSTENQKYLWANAFGSGGYIRIEPDEPDDAKKFQLFLNPEGAGTFPFENSNDYCGRVWYTSPVQNILGVYDPKTKKWENIKVPGFPPRAGNFEVIMHRGPGPYMWFCEGATGRIGRYTLDKSCTGEPT